MFRDVFDMKLSDDSSSACGFSDDDFNGGVLVPNDATKKWMKCLS